MIKGILTLLVSAVVLSPDGKLSLSVKEENSKALLAVEYQKEKLIENSPVGIDFQDAYFGDNVKITKGKAKLVVDEYDLPVGKSSHVKAVCREMEILLQDKSGRMVKMILRAYNDAVAYRYEIPSQEGMDSLRVRNERMDLHIVGNPSVKALFLPDFHNSHEGFYTTAPLKELEQDKLMDMPLLLSYKSGKHLAVTEANLVEYAGMYLINKGGVLTSALSPRLDRPELSVISSLPHKSPWRVFLVSDRAGALLESNVITSLADPCPYEDLSWIKPGKTTFTWWCDFQLPDTTWQRGNNYRSNKYYIDFAAQNGIEYHSVYGYADMPWYYDDGPSFGVAGPGADLTRYDPRLDFPRVCSYAQSVGVDMHVWLNWAALYKDIDNVFDKFNQWGVKGMMVDFMDRDDQQMIEIQQTILSKAMEHHLFIQFHGASKPSGLHRTYPCEFTREGTLNYEAFKFRKGAQLDAAHDLNMPFTRCLAGAADYHLGGFRAQRSDQFVPVHSRPNVKHTRCHMLAMYVVLESYIHMVADAPDAYRNQPGFEFLKAVPTVWDETKVPVAEVDKYICVARRKGEQWYLGGITGNDLSQISFPLDFLGEGEYQMELFTDNELTNDDPNLLTKKVLTVSAQSSLEVKMEAAGGFAARIYPKR